MQKKSRKKMPLSGAVAGGKLDTDEDFGVLKHDHKHNPNSEPLSCSRTGALVAVWPAQKRSLRASCPLLTHQRHEPRGIAAVQFEILNPFRGPQIPADGPQRRSKIAATMELLDLNASELDHLRPFFGFIRNQLAELGWSHHHRVGAQGRESSLEGRVG
jgi:hypothetical protein